MHTGLPYALGRWWPAPFAPRELPRASPFAAVHLVRLWDTGVIRSVASAAAAVVRPQRETMNRQRAHFPVNASVTGGSGNVWHSALDASARASSAKIGQPCCFDEGLHRCKRTSHSSRTIYAATLMVNRMSRSVRVGPPAPDLLFLFATTIAFQSSFNSWHAIALDYFTYCEVPLVSAHCDAQASERGHAGVSRCCE